jgi:hypothetical protein
MESQTGRLYEVSCGLLSVIDNKRVVQGTCMVMSDLLRPQAEVVKGDNYYAWKTANIIISGREILLGGLQRVTTALLMSVC